jgi:clan AA aspartic protease (TIGR02281 family)
MKPLTIAGLCASLLVGIWWGVRQLSPSSAPAGVFAVYTTKPVQTLAQIETELARQIFRELLACTQAKARENARLNNGFSFDFDKIQADSALCFLEVVMLTPDGKVRQNIETRLTRIVFLVGGLPPAPTVSGQGEVKITPVAATTVYAVPVQVKGKSYTFLLDTGASSSIIDQRLAQTMGLRGTPIPSKLLSYSVVGDNCDQIRAAVLTLPEMQVDRAKVTGLSGMSINRVPGELAGVLGLDFLSNYNVYIHPQKKKLALLPRSSPPQDDKLLPMVGKLGVMTINTKVNGREAAPFLLDTGAGAMVIADSEAKALGVDVTDAPTIDVLGFCGTEKAKLVKLKSVQIGEHQLTNLEAVVIRGDILELLGVKGIVGQNYLNRYEQYWYFGDRNALGYPKDGFLSLTPILNR